MPYAADRVLFVSSPERPGADTFIHALLMRHIDRSRFEVHVAYNAGPPGAGTSAAAALSSIPDLHLRPTDFGPSLSGKSRARQIALTVRTIPAIADLVGLAIYIRRNRIRVVHSTDRVRDALPCVVLGKLTGAKSVVHVHLGYGEWMSPVVRWALAHATARLCISEFVARSLVEHGCSPQRTFVALNAIDAAAWDPTLSAEGVRRELGLSPGCPVVTCIARIFPSKGHADLLRAVALVRRDCPEVRLLVVGRDERSATPGNESFTAQLRNLASQLGIAENVIFTGFRSDTAAVLAASDVFAMPSFEEPFGLVFLEAMAMKRPIVALNNGGTKEVIEDGKSGLLSGPADVTALARNITRLLRDPVLRREMGEYGRRQVEARFSAERMAGDVERVYRQLLGS